MVLLLSYEPREKMELNETSSDKNSSVDNGVKNNNDQTTQVGTQTSPDIKANEEIAGEKFTANGPETPDKGNLTLVDPMARLTSNYFCFECGAVLTTLEDKKQHELLEIKGKHLNGSEKSE
ncbi:hypothetical protein NARC_160114 [Candidatus Nitrosocosmicus arcticus]|uniref:Uncharacterized protein n=1 Tax=Candidatus Nitrosocosmicus arcticus TaxID=2035267 RepID=A0A557SS22_9ARCH|nr:hypothetical protein NARC_160114 [Candidatus Nitrosocosmicus arcticus]